MVVKHKKTVYTSIHGFVLPASLKNNVNDGCLIWGMVKVDRQNENTVSAPKQAFCISYLSENWEQWMSLRSSMIPVWKPMSLDQR